MSPTTLELETSSTTHADSDDDLWISMIGNEYESSQYVRLCPFDYAVNDELERIAALEVNWDAEGARAIDGRVISAAREFVSALPARIKTKCRIPAVAPMRKGNLQFEWHDGPRTLEFEFEWPGQVHYLKWHPEAGIEEEDTVPLEDVSTFVELLKWFLKG